MWRYDEERLKLKDLNVSEFFPKLGTVKIDEPSYSTQNIYECADTWVSQGNIHQWSCSLFQRLLQG